MDIGINLKLSDQPTLAEIERVVIEDRLKVFNGNKRAAAKTLGCSAKTLYNKLNEYAREGPKQEQLS